MTVTFSSTSHLRTEDGRRLALDVRKWLAPADPVDESLLERVVAPVLDVGCGPGRHVQALFQRDVEALGLDISPTAVAIARRNGATVLQRSVFDTLPHPGRWRSALLLDGSIGIGGDPGALLRHVSGALADESRILVETEASDVRSESMLACIETASGQSPWFSWARVSHRDLSKLAAEAGLELACAWEDAGRWFGQLERSMATALSA